MAFEWKAFGKNFLGKKISGNIIQAKVGIFGQKDLGEWRESDDNVNSQIFGIWSSSLHP